MNVDTSNNDIPVMEDPFDVSESDGVTLDPWLDPDTNELGDVSTGEGNESNDSQYEVVEIDIEPILSELETINNNFNILIGTLILFAICYFCHGIANKINTKGKGIN